MVGTLELVGSVLQNSFMGGGDEGIVNLLGEGTGDVRFFSYLFVKVVELTKPSTDFIADVDRRDLHPVDLHEPTLTANSFASPGGATISKSEILISRSLSPRSSPCEKSSRLPD